MEGEGEGCSPLPLVLSVAAPRHPRQAPVSPSKPKSQLSSVQFLLLAATTRGGHVLG